MPIACEERVTFAIASEYFVFLIYLFQLPLQVNLSIQSLPFINKQKSSLASFIPWSSLPSLAFDSLHWVLVFRILLLGPSRRSPRKRCLQRPWELERGEPGATWITNFGMGCALSVKQLNMQTHQTLRKYLTNGQKEAFSSANVPLKVLD